MSSNSSCVGPCMSPSSLSGLISPVLSGLITVHTFTILYIPLLVALFYFSTKQSRQRPIFSLNIAGIVIALANGIVVDALAIHGILDPLAPWLALNIVSGFLGVWQSITIDLTLLFRLIAVYPPNYVGPINFLLLITIPVLLKLTRVINIFLFTKVMVDALNGPNPSVQMAVVFVTVPYLKIEWAAQMIDNTYASVAFLWKMHQHRSNPVTTTSSRATVAQRMRTVFRIAATNFVIPTLFSIVQFICAYRNVDAITLNIIIFVNVAVATFGVAFATVWAGSVGRQETLAPSTKNSYTTSRLMAIFGNNSKSDANQSSTVMIDGQSSFPRSHEDAKV